MRTPLLSQLRNMSPWPEEFDQWVEGGFLREFDVASDAANYIRESTAAYLLAGGEEAGRIVLLFGDLGSGDYGPVRRVETLDQMSLAEYLSVALRFDPDIIALEAPVELTVDFAEALLKAAQTGHEVCLVTRGNPNSPLW